MKSAATAKETHVDDWDAHQETHSLLSFARRERAAQEEISELLTRKFREFFP